MQATEREKAILFALAAGNIKDWKTAYILSSQKPEETLRRQKALNSSVTRWRQRDEIKLYFREAQKEIEQMKDFYQNEGREEARKMMERKEGGESEHTETQKKTQKDKNLDFYDPANQRRQINQIIQQAQDDPKTQLDAIKAIQQTQRDDRQAAKDNKIQRFYVPVTCKTCPLMEKAAKKFAK